MSSVFITNLGVLDSQAAAAAAEDAAGTRFHLFQFLEQFWVQLLVPLSVPYLLIAHSCSAAANVLSVPRPFNCVFALIFFFAQTISMMPLVVLLAWALRGPAVDGTDAAAAVLRVDVVAVAATLLMHRLAIAIKYAYQPHSVYRRRMTSWVTYQERLDDQLFASWFKLTPETIEREVQASVKSLEEGDAGCAIELSRASFSRLRGGVHEGARASLACADAPGDQGCSLPVRALVATLLSHVNETTSGYVLALQRATTLAGLISMFSTTVLRAALGLPVVGSTPLEGCLIISAWISNFLLLPTTFTFLAVGIVDHARRESALEALSRLYLPTSLRIDGGSAGLLSVAVHKPILPLESIADVRAFLTVRSLLLSFGAGFHSRLITVITSDLLVLAGVVAFCIYAIFTPSSVGSMLAPLVLYHSLFLPSIALCGLGLFMAARTNAAAAQSASVIAHARLSLRIAAHETGLAAPQTLVALLDDVERLLRDNAVPVTFFGIAAMPALTNALLGGIFSLETLLVSAFVTRVSSAQPAVSGGSAAPPGAPTTTSPSPSPSPPPPGTAAPKGGGDASADQASVGYFVAALVAAVILAALAMAVRRRRAAHSSAHKPALTASALDAAAAPAMAENPLRAAALAQQPAGGTPKGGATGSGSAVADSEGDWVEVSDGKETWFENLKTGETAWSRP